MWSRLALLHSPILGAAGISRSGRGGICRGHGKPGRPRRGASLCPAAGGQWPSAAGNSGSRTHTSAQSQVGQYPPRIGVAVSGSGITGCRYPVRGAGACIARDTGRRGGSGAAAPRIGGKKRRTFSCNWQRVSGRPLRHQRDAGDVTVDDHASGGLCSNHARRHGPRRRQRRRKRAVDPPLRP